MSMVPRLLTQQPAPRRRHTYSMRRTILTTFVLAAVVLPVSAQDQTPVFRAESTLVEFTLIAIDKDGKPVTDLKREEIVVKDKGRPRDLAVFRYEGGEQPRITPSELPIGIFTNSPDLTPGAPRNVTAIVLDTLNTQPREQTWVKAQAMRYLGGLMDNTRVAVYLLGQDLTVVHDFSDDAASLRGRIGHIPLREAAPTLGMIDDMAREMDNLLSWMEAQRMSQPVIVALLQGERFAHQSADEQRTRTTLQLLEGLGDHLAGIPGRKSIVWFGSGTTMLSISGALEKNTVGGSISHEELIRDTARRLAQQGVTMYMFDARGMQIDANSTAEIYKARSSIRGNPNDPYERLKANATLSADTTPAMAKFAAITGGRFYWNTNDVGRAVDEIVADSEGTYSLGFYADGEPDDKWHNLDVSVARKGVKLQHRDGYMSAAPAAEPLDWTEDQWRAAVYNPVGSTAVQLDARLRFDGATTISMTMQISVDALHFRQVDGQSSAAVDVAIVDKLPNAQFRVQRTPRKIAYPMGEYAEMGVTNVSHTWELTPDASVVRLIVRDRLTNRYGTLDVPVKDIPHAQPQPNPNAEEKP